MPSEYTPLCTLVDRTIEYVTDDGFRPYEPGDVYTIEELVTHLWVAVGREPHILDLDIPGGIRAVLAIGGPMAAVYVCPLIYPGRNAPVVRTRTWTAQPHRTLAVEYTSFRRATSEVDVPAHRLMPAEEVIRIAAYFVENSDLPDTHQWRDDEGTVYRRDVSEPLLGLIFPPDTIPF